MPLDCIETQTGPEPAWAVLFLHGLGDSGNGFAPIVPALVRPGWPPVRFVFPHAPVRAVTLNAGMRMRAWYDIISLDRLSLEDEKGMRESVGHVEALISREEARGIPASRIVVAGFSQGGAIAVATGLRRTRALAGIGVLSSYLPMAAATMVEITTQARSTPVFMAHGDFDPVIPAAFGRISRDQLIALGMQVEWHSYPIAHNVSDDEVAALAAWLGTRLCAR
ncbi:MAG TPA: dienelactone hydrolase family protein [Xanthomonadaceae bacterium]|nr:dienelactone hydrolase family protein [Xanthomonadaceae bacterium]